MFPLNRNNNNNKQVSRYLTCHHPKHRKWFFWRNFRFMWPERSLAKLQWVAEKIWTYRPTCLVIWMIHARQVIARYSTHSRGLWGIVHSGNLKYAIRSILPLNVTVINMCEKLWDWIDTSGKEIDQRRKDLVLCVRAVKTLNEEFCWVWYKNLLKCVQHVLHDFFPFNQSYEFCSDTCKRSVACSSRSGTCQLQVNSFVPVGNDFIFVRYPQVLNFLKVFFSLFLPEAHKEPEKQNEASPEKTDKENVLHKNPDNKPSYKYVEVVRKRDERAKLNGYDCRECQQVQRSCKLSNRRWIAGRPRR